jgi:hypothetical protein
MNPDFSPLTWLDPGPAAARLAMLTVIQVAAIVAFALPLGGSGKGWNRSISQIAIHSRQDLSTRSAANGRPRCSCQETWTARSSWA